MNSSYGNYPDLSDVKKVLVIKLRHLGDVLLSAPVFSNLKKQFPDAEIDAYIWAEAKPMLEGHRGVSNFTLHHRGWKKLSFFKQVTKELSLLRMIRKEGYDLVVNLTEGDRGALATFASGARVRVGVDPGKSGFAKKRQIFTHLVKPCSTPRHTVEKDLDALRRIGIFAKMDERFVEFVIPDESKESALEMIQSEGLEPGGFTLIHPVSRWGFKCLPPAKMAEVIDRLDSKVVLTGGPSEREMEMAEEIARLSQCDVVNFAGKTSLKELGALMQLSKGMITVDSVALHMGSALQIPLVALFGPTSEKNWGPWMHPRGVVVAQNPSCRPCRLDGCGGSKMSDCLWSLSSEAIVKAYDKAAYPSEGAVAAAGTCGSSLFVLNSLEMNFTE